MRIVPDEFSRCFFVEHMDESVWESRLAPPWLGMHRGRSEIATETSDDQSQTSFPAVRRCWTYSHLDDKPVWRISCETRSDGGKNRPHQKRDLQRWLACMSQ